MRRLTPNLRSKFMKYTIQKMKKINEVKFTIAEKYVYKIYNIYTITK